MAKRRSSKTDKSVKANKSKSRKSKSAEEVEVTVVEEAAEFEAEADVMVVETEEDLEAAESEEGAEMSEDEMSEDKASEDGDEALEMSEDDIASAESDDEETLFASESEDEVVDADVEGTELGAYESAEIEDLEVIEEEQLDSIIESMLFATDKPISVATFRATFKGTTVKSEHIRQSLKRLQLELAGGRRGVTLEEVPGGFQIRTKIDNLKFLTRSVKPRFFKVSGPALEVLAIVAYKQPTVKAEIDEIRGVESGHLLRALMEKGLVQFEGKSELPGKPMQYGTTKKFLEIFGLRNLKELPTLSQIDELLPDGIGEEEENKPKLADITDKLSEQIGSTYSEGEEELTKITEQLQDISLTTDFFEQEKLRQKQAREAERAQDIRERILVGENVSKRDRNWLERYDTALKDGTAFVDPDAPAPAAAAPAGDVGAEGAVSSAPAAGSGEEPAGASVQDPKSKEDRSVGSLVSSAASIFAESGFADDEDSAPRFEEEEDRSLDGDLNVDMHDEE